MGGHHADGWCSYHAFNTYLLFSGKQQQEIVLPSDDNFNKFGDWFLKRFKEQYLLNEEKGILSEEGETQGSMKTKVEEMVKMSPRKLVNRRSSPLQKGLIGLLRIMMDQKFGLSIRNVQEALIYTRIMIQMKFSRTKKLYISSKSMRQI